MRQSKYNKHKLGHYYPIEDCKMEKFTYGEICLECGLCGRFKSIARRKRKVKKKFAIDYRMPTAHYRPWRKWRRWQSYTTEKQRNQALRTLQKKGYYDMDFYEFKKAIDK